MNMKLLMLGGDARQDCLCALLRSRAFEVVRPAEALTERALFDAVRSSRAVLLPHPVTRDGVFVSGTPKNAFLLDTVFSALTPRQRLLGGGFTPLQTQRLQADGIRFLDCAEDEIYLRTNAYLTALGALRLLLTHTRHALPQQRILILGYGRVGKALADLLVALHCDVTVAARSALQRTEAKLSGCRVMETAALSADIRAFHMLVNTVPHRLLPTVTAQTLNASACYLELASAPFGVDRSALSCAWIDGSALPGRFTPDAAALGWLPLVNALMKEGEPS